MVNFLLPALLPAAQSQGLNWGRMKTAINRFHSTFKNSAFEKPKVFFPDLKIAVIKENLELAADNCLNLSGEALSKAEKKLGIIKDIICKQEQNMGNKSENKALVFEFQVIAQKLEYLAIVQIFKRPGLI